MKTLDLGLENTINKYDVRRLTTNEREYRQRAFKAQFNRKSRAGRLLDTPKYTIDFAPYKPEVFFGDAGLKSAAAKTTVLADQHFGKAFHIFVANSREIVQTARLTYEWDDPVWQAQEYCPELWRAIVNQAVMDAVGQVRYVATAQEADSLRAEARIYYKSKFFEHDCEAGDIDASYLRRKIAEGGIYAEGL